MIKFRTSENSLEKFSVKIQVPEIKQSNYLTWKLKEWGNHIFKIKTLNYQYSLLQFKSYINTCSYPSLTGCTQKIG